MERATLIAPLVLASTACGELADHGTEQPSVQAPMAQVAAQTTEPEVETPNLVSWASAVASVEALREGFAQRGEWVHIGTALNAVHVNEHTCSILGRMLGKADQVQHIEVSYSDEAISGWDMEPGISDYDLSVTVQSLDNWLRAARRLIGASQDERVREWNLDCVGQLSIPTTSVVEETNRATFYSLEQNGTVLRVFGDVEAGFAERLDRALDRSPSVRTVALGSAGGRVYEAMVAGQNIRRRQLDTVLWNECLSACTLVFLGGVERRIWSPYPRLGFHLVSFQGETMDLRSDVYQDIAAYSRSMGVDPRAVLYAMAQATPYEMNYPEGKFLCDASIITWMQRAHNAC